MDKLKGRIAYLPDGQKVRIEYVADGLATVRRTDSEWRGRIAVCAVTSLTVSASLAVHASLVGQAG